MPNLIRLVILGTLDTVGVATPIPTNVLGHVLESLLIEQNEIKNRLDRLEQKLDQRIMQPYRNGIIFLEQGLRSGDKETRQRRIYDAQREFFVASQIELDDYPFLPIKAPIYAGVCSDLLADHEDAHNLYKQAHEFAVNYIRGNNPIYYNNKIWFIYKQLSRPKLDLEHFFLLRLAKHVGNLEKSRRPITPESSLEKELEDPLATPIKLPIEEERQSWVKKMQSSRLNPFPRGDFFPEGGFFNPARNDSILRSAGSIMLYELESSIRTENANRRQRSTRRKSDNLVLEQKDLEVGILAVGLTNMISSRKVKT